MAETITGAQNPALDVLWWKRYPAMKIPGNPPRIATNQNVLSLILLRLPPAASLSMPIATKPKRLTSATQSKSGEAGIAGNFSVPGCRGRY